MVCVECAFELFVRQIIANQVSVPFDDIDKQRVAYSKVYEDREGNCRAIVFEFHKLKCPKCRDCSSDSFSAAPLFYDDAIESMYSRDHLKKVRRCVFCAEYMMSSAEHFMHMFALKCSKLKYRCQYETCGKQIDLSPEARKDFDDSDKKTNLDNGQAQHQMMIAAVEHYKEECMGWGCFQNECCDFHGTAEGSVLHGKIHASLTTLARDFWTLQAHLDEGKRYYDEMQEKGTYEASQFANYIAGPVGIQKYSEVLFAARSGIWDACVQKK
jgi:hypothetical protein